MFFNRLNRSLFSWLFARYKPAKGWVHSTIIIQNLTCNLSRLLHVAHKSFGNIINKTNFGTTSCSVIFLLRVILGGFGNFEVVIKKRNSGFFFLYLIHGASVPFHECFLGKIGRKLGRNPVDLLQIFVLEIYSKLVSPISKSSSMPISESIPIFSQILPWKPEISPGYQNC